MRRTVTGTGLLVILAMSTNAMADDAWDDGWGGNEPWKLPTHRTIRREENWEIASIYPDLREGTFFTPPAMNGNIGDGYVAFSYDQQRIDRNNLVHNAEGMRRVGTLSIRESLMWGLGVETQIEGIDAEYDPRKTISDLRSLLTEQILGGRYWAITLEGGTEVAFTNGQDMEDSHQNRFKDPTYVAGIRAGVGTGPIVFGASIRGRYQNHGDLTTAYDRTTATGEDIPQGEYHHKYTDGTVGLSVTYRPIREFRFGIEGDGFYRYWDGKDGAGDIKDWGTDLGIFLEVTPVSWMTLNGGVDFDPTKKDYREVSNREAYAYRACLRFVW